jgi:hypothetical protein
VPLKTSLEDYKNSGRTHSSKSSTSDTPASSDTSSSLYPLLTTIGDEKLKLPPLHIHPRRSSSPASSFEIPPTGSPASSPEPDSEPEHPTLPSIRSIAAAEHLALRVEQISIERERAYDSASDDDSKTMSEMDWEDGEDEERSKRKEHAKFIKDLLILINTEYKRKHGTPKMGVMDDLRSLTPRPGIVMDIAAKVPAATRMLTGPGVPGIQRSMDVEMAAA